MRKYLSLIVEHEAEDHIGLVTFYDSQKSRLTKDEVSPMQTFDKDEGTFQTVGKEVGLGYADFDGQEDYEDRAGEVLRQKLREISPEHLQRAGVEMEDLVQ